MGQTSHWGHLLLSNYCVSPDGYLRPTPNIWTSVGLRKCLNSVLIPVWHRYNFWGLRRCHKRFPSGFDVRWHVAAMSARWVFLHILRFLRVVGGQLWRAEEFRPLPRYISEAWVMLFKVLHSHGWSLSPRIADLTYSLRILFFEGGKKRTLSSSSDGVLVDGS